MVADIKKLEINQAKSRHVQQLLQIAYPNIIIMSDTLVVYEEDEKCTILELDKNGDIKNKFSTYFIQRMDDIPDIEIISYNDTDSINSIIKIEDNAYVAYNTYIGTVIEKHNTYILNCMSMRSRSASSTIILISALNREILLMEDIKEPPLEPYCSIGKIQFLTENNEVYALDQFGNLMMKKESSWKYITIVNNKYHSI